MSKTTKGVINWRYAVSILATGERKGRFRTLTRVVRDIEKVEGPGDPPEFHKHETPEWAKEKQWTLYKGAARVHGADCTVKGWSWNDDLPQIWGLDEVNSRHSDLSAWLWLHLTDWRDAKVTPYRTRAAEFVRKYLED